MTLFTFVAPPAPCAYLPAEQASMEYARVDSISPEDYLERMKAGWRHFGHVLFRPRCRACSACRSLRVLAGGFHPDRSQRRAWKANADLRVVVGTPSVDPVRLDLYDRYHAYQTEARDWPDHGAKDAESYVDSFVRNPFPVREWCYYLGDQLVGVGYADDLPGCLSAIYFFHDPAQRHRSLGTFNLLSLIDHAARRGLAHVYLGYHVAGCQSMEYKARFRPNQVLGVDGHWRDFV